MAKQAPRVPGAPSEATSTPIPASAPAAGEETTSLPNSIDINPRAIRGPVLTKQGWVCPDEDWQKANPAEFQKLQG
jgi:hypothetical protein